MENVDTVLTRISKVSLAAASHLSNTFDFRKPSDVRLTATLSSREHGDKETHAA